MPLSDHLEAALASFIYKNNAAAFASPGDGLYVALFTADTGLETNAPTAEVSGTGYARQQVTAANWLDNFDGTVQNAAIIDFGSAGSAWGVVTHAAVMDALSGGNVLHFGTLTVSRDVANGDPVTFPIGALVLGFD